MDHDLVVIGGGSAGLVAAQLAAYVGADVVLVEREESPGGDCLWTGCVPSKALIASAQRTADARAASALGVAVDGLRVDFAAVMAHVRAAQARIEPHDSFRQLGAHGVATVHGSARVSAPRRVEVTDAQGTLRVLTARHVLLAAGSTPQLPPIAGVEQPNVLTTDDVWQLEELPARLLVVGGGAVGSELGQAFARLGSAVTLVEPGTRVLAHEEPVASELVDAALRADGVDVRTGASVQRFHATGAELSDGSSCPFDRALVSVGRRSRGAGILDESLHSLLDEGGHVVVDPRQRTACRGIWAAGDVTGQLPFTNAAGLQGANAALNALLGLRRRFDPGRVPWVTFTDPEVGRVGASLEQAREQLGDRVRVDDFPLSRLDRAATSARTEGQVRLVTDRGRRLLGATVVARVVSRFT